MSQLFFQPHTQPAAQPSRKFASQNSIVIIFTCASPRLAWPYYLAVNCNHIELVKNACCSVATTLNCPSQG